MNLKFTNPTGFQFKEIKNAIGNDEMRPAFHYVNIDIEKGYAIATDAHIMVAYPLVFESKETDLKQVLLHPNFFNPSRYMEVIAKKDFDKIEYVLESEFATVLFKGEMVFRTKYVQDVKYPDIWVIMPEKINRKPISRIGLDRLKMKRICDLFPLGISNALEFSFYAENRNVYVESVEPILCDIKAVIMPVMLPAE